ncbi:MAG: DUF370 domain-containing protein [Ruminococcaceae bacterium]|nr:DUF370 domain-containing protein [Oscillospiraceae bacterium]
MYLHLGGEWTVDSSEIIGIFDLDRTTVKKKTREFLSAAEQKGKVIYTSLELPKAFLVCQKEDKEQVFITQLSCQTLLSRYERWGKGREIDSPELR